ncbi:hypothetical protein ACJX0J_039982, partial [Zea mays]
MQLKFWFNFDYLFYLSLSLAWYMLHKQQEVLTLTLSCTTQTEHNHDLNHGQNLFKYVHLILYNTVLKGTEKKRTKLAAIIWKTDNLDRFSGEPKNEPRIDTTVGWGTVQESKRNWRFRTKWKQRTSLGDHQMNKRSIFNKRRVMSRTMSVTFHSKLLVYSSFFL